MGAADSVAIIVRWRPMARARPRRIAMTPAFFVCFCGRRGRLSPVESEGAVSPPRHLNQGVLESTPCLNVFRCPSLKMVWETRCRTT